MKKLENLVGLTPTSIVAEEDEITLNFEGGASIRFYHEQNCCENVWVEDVNGDWDDLLNTTLLVIDERVSYDAPNDSEEIDSDSWTFYTFRSIKGSVDVRWHGSSNGYYSTSVDWEIEGLS